MNENRDVGTGQQPRAHRLDVCQVAGHEHEGEDHGGDAAEDGKVDAGVARALGDRCSRREAAGGVAATSTAAARSAQRPTGAGVTAQKSAVLSELTCEGDDRENHLQKMGERQN